METSVACVAGTRSESRQRRHFYGATRGSHSECVLLAKGGAFLHRGAVIPFNPGWSAKPDTPC